MHLSEILLGYGSTDEAEAVLTPALASGDPEVHWRLAETDAHLDAARLGFEAPLTRHLLAFADHAAEFYAGSGLDARRAPDLARVNVANCPTLRAYAQAHAIAGAAGDVLAASELFDEAARRLGGSPVFRLSPLAQYWSDQADGAAP